MIRIRNLVEMRTTVRGSRFVAVLAPSTDASEAERIMTERARHHRDATHHCWGYRVWNEGAIVTAGFDAGEPSGTAGRPIVGALESSDVVQTVCVVSRWFGGTKLGTGGLSRAYGEAARAAVESAREARLVNPVEVLASFRIQYAYAQTAALKRAVASLEAVELEADYGEWVDAVFAVPARRADSFHSAIEETMGGGPDVERLPDRLLDWPREGRLPSNRS